MKISLYRLTREVMQLKKTYTNYNLTQPNHNCENNNINKYAFIGLTLEVMQLKKPTQIKT